MRALLDRRIIRVLLSVLPFISFTGFITTLRICKALYDALASPNEARGSIHSMSQYGTGPWDPDARDPSLPTSHNLTIFRVGIVIFVLHILVILCSRTGMLLLLLEATRRADNRAPVSCLVGASFVLTAIANVNLIGVAVVTYHMHHDAHFAMATLWFTLLPLSQILETIATALLFRRLAVAARHGTPPATATPPRRCCSWLHSAPSGALHFLAWNVFCILGCVGCATGHIIVYSPPLQWAAGIFPQLYCLSTYYLVGLTTRLLGGGGVVSATAGAVVDPDAVDSEAAVCRPSAAEMTAPTFAPQPAPAREASIVTKASIPAVFRSNYGYSYRSKVSAAAALSVASILSIGSIGSVAAVASVGSVLSIGSVGSLLSIGSYQSVLAVGCASGSFMCFASECDGSVPCGVGQQCAWGELPSSPLGWGRLCVDTE